MTEDAGGLGQIELGVAIAAVVVSIVFGILTLRDGRRKSSAASTFLAAAIEAELEVSLRACIDLVQELHPPKLDEDEEPVSTADIHWANEYWLVSVAANATDSRKVLELANAASLRLAKERPEQMNHLPRDLVDHLARAVRDVQAMQNIAIEVDSIQRPVAPVNVEVAIGMVRELRSAAIVALRSVWNAASQVRLHNAKALASKAK